jgi:pimeloyl-ACP methyl ester carboxylesterase
LALSRAGLKVIATAVPGFAEEIAARKFFTPRRSARWMAPAISGQTPASFRLRLDGDEIACWSWGRGPTVLLLHGWEGFAAQLIHFAPPLLAAGFRVVTFDMPAHGASTGRTEVTAFDMATAICAVADICAPTRAVIAHSLGGTASILALHRGLKVQRAAFLAPGTEPAYFARALAVLLGLSNDRAAGMLRRIERRLGMRMVDANALRFVPTVGVPLLLLHDPADPEVPFEQSKRLAQAWPGSRLELLRGMGHRRMLRAPAVIDRVIAFITGEGEKLTSPGSVSTSPGEAIARRSSAAISGGALHA